MIPVELTLPDGSTRTVGQGSTGADLVAEIGLKRIIAMEVDGQVQGLYRSFDKPAKVNFLTFYSEGGKHAFWHSSAHVFAHAIKRLYPHAKATIGPPVEQGFYYDFDDLDVTPDDFEKIEAEMEKIIKEDLPFTRDVISLDQAKQMFKGNQYKLEMAQEYAGEGQELTTFSDGDFSDLCEGPHVSSTGVIGAIKLTKVSGAYWRGKQENQQLTRVYGVSFPTSKEMRKHMRMLEEASKRDHRVLGKQLDLFSFHEESPGAPFLHPKGTIIFNELQNFIRGEYKKRGYDEVITPLIYDKSLWETSGHWQHFKENMFVFNVDGRESSLKPMNCPSHCLLYKVGAKSYRDLPIRLADFAVLHRNELRGTLSGLTRVRKMQQDDSHIFCTLEQLDEEIKGVIDFMKYVYEEVFQVDYNVELSTKPDKALGTEEQWNTAEGALQSALENANIKFKINAGDGAFYGPKIDIHMKDSLGRSWQLATIQLDFQLPQRFALQYEGSDGSKHTPVMIHRAILGTLDRFLGVLIEHYAGKFPMWLSPEQVRILTVADRFNNDAQKMVDELVSAGVRAKLDGRTESINKKVREAQLEYINYICVVGEKELGTKSVTVRTRNNEILGMMTLDEFKKKVLAEITSRKLDQ
jgi:threonyl-tRNA synthetase